jgi:glycosyltransferase involved in cell wall biosynthesis
VSHPQPSSDRVAVAIPCYNEAAALGPVIDEWRAALPYADLFVFDNNSTDDSARIARERGVTVVPVPGQGKGHVVQALFGLLADRPAVVMIDGDGTYPAAIVHDLLDPILADRADMAIGVRRPIPGERAMSPVRRLGNLLIRSAFRLLIGPGHPDLLTGYRVFGPRFLREVTPRSAGFEIETELGCEAVARGLRVAAVETDYRPRAPGTHSKLRAFADGRRILRTIIYESLTRRPLRFLAALALLSLMVALLVSAIERLVF